MSIYFIALQQLIQVCFYSLDWFSIFHFPAFFFISTFRWRFWNKSDWLNIKWCKTHITTWDQYKEIHFFGGFFLNATACLQNTPSDGMHWILIILICCFHYLFSSNSLIFQRKYQNTMLILNSDGDYSSTHSMIWIRKTQISMHFNCILFFSKYQKQLTFEWKTIR